jgi:hypothetical protein
MYFLREATCFNIGQDVEIIDYTSCQQVRTICPSTILPMTATVTYLNYFYLEKEGVPFSWHTNSTLRSFNQYIRSGQFRNSLIIAEAISNLVVEVTDMSKVEIYPEKLRVMTTVPPSICNNSGATTILI